MGYGFPRRPWEPEKVSGHEIADHFAEVGKMVDIGSGYLVPTLLRGNAYGGNVKWGMDSHGDRGNQEII